MSSPRSRHTIDRFAEIGDLALAIRALIDRALFPFGAALVLASGYLWFTHHPGTICFALVSVGTLVVLHVWRRQGLGIPVIPMLAVQNLLAYGLPILVNNPTLAGYSETQFTDAGVELLVFSCCMTAVWRLGTHAMNPSSPLCFALQGFEDRNLSKLSRLGFGLSVGATVYILLRSVGLLDFVFDLLPSGTSSIVNVVVSGTSACGFFLGAMMLGKGGLSYLQAIVFWVMFGLNCYIAASAFLISTTTTIVFSVFIGLFWGTGRIPWRFIVSMLCVLAFFNAGKTEMRTRYWRQGEGDGIPQFSFSEMPARYREWTVASFEALTGAEDTSRRASDTELTTVRSTNKSGQSLFDRVNNLQNILFVIDAMTDGQRPPLGGATYTLIPPLLVPRILWPEKPRTHEGQVLLNVHFGRQDITSTFQTYIAWGLQAEAYGNYGPIMGNALLGLVVGLLFAWIEKFISRKLLLSLEGFLGFTLFLGMANSFEMVASVLVTSIFQSFFPVIIASRPFVRQVVPRRPTGEIDAHSGRPVTGSA